MMAPMDEDSLPHGRLQESQDAEYQSLDANTDSQTTEIQNSELAVDSMMASDSDSPGHPFDHELPSLDIPFGDNEVAGEVTAGTQQSTLNDYRSPAEQTDSDEENEASSSDHDMDVTPIDSGIKKVPSTKTSSKAGSQAKTGPSREHKPLLRSRKRQRISSSSDGSENESDEDDAGDSTSNPIDVDLYASIWEPAPATDPVSKLHIILR